MKRRPRYAVPLTSAAIAVDLTYAALWRAIYVQKIVPPPKWHVGRRSYYSPKGLMEAFYTVKKLKAEGKFRSCHDTDNQPTPTLLPAHSASGIVSPAAKITTSCEP